MNLAKSRFVPRAEPVQSTTLQKMERAEAHPISVFLVDEHPILLKGLEDLIETTPQLSLAGSAANLEDAEKGIVAAQPNVVVLDFFIGEKESLPLIPRIQRSGVPAVLTLSISRGLGLIDQALRLGALGHVGKHEPPARIIEGILAVAAGRMFLDGGIAQELLRWRSQQPAAGRDSMTPREKEIYRFIGEGQSSPEIAARLGLSAKTIEAHKENLKRKLGAKSSSELRKWAIQSRHEEQTSHQTS